MGLCKVIIRINEVTTLRDRGVHYGIVTTRAHPHIRRTGRGVCMSAPLRVSEMYVLSLTSVMKVRQLLSVQ